MANIEAMRAQVQELNRQLKNKYEEFFSMDNFTFRQEVLNKIGTISSLKKLSPSEMNEIGGLVGVDGSVMKVGGAEPHYVEIYQALAKPTNGEPYYTSQIYSPIIDKNGSEVIKREVMLAQIEMDAAMYAAENDMSKILMMDGGLIRYKINDSKKFQELVDICLEKNIILMGVIKDLKTDIISRAMGKSSFYDRELIYGRLDKGELLVINDEYNKKFDDAKLISAFLRCSIDSMIIGLDILEEYRKDLQLLANLVFTITPEHSRGVPLWLDIVDAEVKITDQMVRSVLEEHMDRDIYRRFFMSERDGRKL